MDLNIDQPATIPTSPTSHASPLPMSPIASSTISLVTALSAFPVLLGHMQECAKRDNLPTFLRMVDDLRISSSQGHYAMTRIDFPSDIANHHEHIHVMLRHVSRYEASALRQVLKSLKQ